MDFEPLLEIWGRVGLLWPQIVSTLSFVAGVVAAAHVILYKRNTRSAVGWVGIIVLVPFFGPLLYFVFGINRIRRRANRRRTLRQVHIGAIRAMQPTQVPPDHHPNIHLQNRAGAEQIRPSERPTLNGLSNLVDEVSRADLLPGNAFEPLRNGDEAYPAMLAAIEAAKTSVALSTYIFDNDAAGREFAEALGRAVARGVEVRVLIDAVGARYTIPPVTWVLKRKKVPVARYGRTLLPWRFAYFNLRNHRKILVVDGTHGFTGGMNIRHGHVVGADPRHPVADLHFRVEGPVVKHLMEAFALDWAFTTGERLGQEKWFPPLEPAGATFARGITDGPDEDYERLHWTILGALASAQRSVHIMTPYFCPDPPFLDALNVAAMRGARVDLILPAKNNLAFVDWASQAVWGHLIRRGVRLFRTTGPFDHTKLMVVDAEWVLLGSANWDPRSLRLNFEFDVEAYDKALAEELLAFIQKQREQAERVTLKQIQARALPVRLRNGMARLLQPYL